MTREIRSLAGPTAVMAAMVLLPAGAQADSTAVSEAGHVSRTAAEVTAYWTPERMRKAKPADLVVPQDDPSEPPAPVVGPPVKSFELTDTTSFPNRVHGKVFFTKPGAGNFVCSGTAVLAGNDSTVLTAGHCVNDGGVWSTNFVFAPGYRNGNAPFGTWAASDELAPTEWVQSENFRYDVGAAVMARNSSGAEVEDVVGGRGILFNQPVSGSVRSHGYPAVAPFDGLKLWACDSLLGLIDNPGPGPGPSTMGILCDMNGGSSGGGWVVNDPQGNGFLVSVNSYKYVSQPALMFGPYFGDTVAALYGTVEGIPPGIASSPSAGGGSSSPAVQPVPVSSAQPVCKKVKKRGKRKKRVCRF